MNEHKIPERDGIDDKFKWDLTTLFNSDGDWETLYSVVEKELSGFDTYKERLHESPEVLREAIDFHLAMMRNFQQIYLFSHLKNDEDKTNQHHEAMFQKATNLYTRISEKSSFISPEIQSIPEETMSSFMKDPALSKYSFYLEQILRFRPHTRSSEIEQILAMAKEVTGAPSQVFGQLDNADLTFGTITDENGIEKELSHGNFVTFHNSQSREVRKTAFDNYYKVYDAHRHTIAATLASSIKKDNYLSKVRNYESSRCSSLFRDNVDKSVYDNLIETVKNNLSPLFKYLDLRKKLLGLDELHIYDTYVPIVNDVKFHMPYEEAVETCVAALEPLGKEYTDILKKGLLEGWVDRYENKGKRSGAYSSGCYDSLPYILMNYEETSINSLYTLIHEAGHSMHSYYSRKNQPYVYADYTIFVAEVASTLNETLLGRHLLERYKDDPKMKAYIVNREIDNIRGTLFRQTMFAEFEKLTHKTVAGNAPLTLDTLTGIYRDLLEIYFGETITIDDALCLECLRIPHFYSAFYVYKYATGISAAISLAEGIMNDGEPAVTKYKNFLKLGGSKFPIDELKDAGVDMTSPEPIKQAILHFEGLVNQLEALFSQLQ